MADRKISPIVTRERHPFMQPVGTCLALAIAMALAAGCSSEEAGASGTPTPAKTVEQTAETPDILGTEVPGYNEGQPDKEIQDIPPPEIPNVGDPETLGIPSKYEDYSSYAEYLQTKYSTDTIFVNATFDKSDYQYLPELPPGFDDSDLGKSSVGLMTLKIDAQQMSANGQGSVVAMTTCHAAIPYNTSNKEVFLPNGISNTTQVKIAKPVDTDNPIYVHVHEIKMGHPEEFTASALPDFSERALLDAGCLPFTPMK